MVAEGESVITGGPVVESGTNPIQKDTPTPFHTSATIPLAPPSDAAGAVLLPVAEMLRPVAIQAASEAAAAGHAVTTQLVAGVQSDLALVQKEARAGITALAARVAANEGRIEDALAQAGQAVVNNVVADPVTQRHLALALVLLLGEAAILFLAFYLSGSPEAKGIVGWAVVPGGLATFIALRVAGLLQLPRVAPLRTQGDPG